MQQICVVQYLFPLRGSAMENISAAAEKAGENLLEVNAMDETNLKILLESVQNGSCDIAEAIKKDVNEINNFFYKVYGKVSIGRGRTEKANIAKNIYHMKIAELDWTKKGKDKIEITAQYEKGEWLKI